MDYEIGDTVYALRVLGRNACCEAPSMLFAMRGDELEIIEIEGTNQYDKKFWYKVRLKRGPGSFYVTSGDITKMKHFDHNYDSFQKEWDKEKAREYSGY